MVRNHISQKIPVQLKLVPTKHKPDLIYETVRGVTHGDVEYDLCMSVQ